MITFLYNPEAFFIKIFLYDWKTQEKDSGVHGFLTGEKYCRWTKFIGEVDARADIFLLLAMLTDLKIFRGKSKHHNVAGGNARIVTFPGLTKRFRAN